MVVEIARVAATEWATLRDVRLAALRESPDAFASSHDVEVAHSDAEWCRRATMWASGAAGASFIARRGAGVVGLVGAHRPGPGTAVELVSMWTSPAARRLGVGRALVEAVIEWAGDDEIRLWVMRGNDGAAELYRRCGFVVTDETQVLDSDPCKNELRMRRSPQSFTEAAETRPG